MITGNLAEDSPSLSSKLKRLFNIKDFEDFSLQYNLVCKSPLILTENSHREVGVNFNPKPARILDILLESKITDKNYLQKSLIDLPKILENLELIHSSQFSNYQEISLAILLDELRHLCYIPNPQDKYHELLRNYQTLKNSCKTPSPSATYLSNKLNTSFRQYQKYA